MAVKKLIEVALPLEAINKESARHGPPSAIGTMAIERLRLYLETTVFNYYFDKDREGHQDVVTLFDMIGAGEYEGYSSRYVADELMGAPEPKRTNMVDLIGKYGITVLNYSTEATRLANIYREAKIIPASHRLDSLHIATATVYKLDYVISYNFQHINREKTKLRVAVVNEHEGYKGIRICTAKEVLRYGRGEV